MDERDYKALNDSLNYNIQQAPSILLPQLTKREYFAGLAMQSLLSKISISYKSSDAINDSIAIADELLKQLEHGTK
jgi:hypothetical protein